MKRFMIGAAAGATGVLLLALLVGQIPTKGFEGVDDRMVVHRMPLWEKAAKFYIRDKEFRQWAEEAAGGETDPQRRVLRLMEWTRNVVKPIPSGLPGQMPWPRLLMLLGLEPHDGNWHPEGSANP